MAEAEFKDERRVCVLGATVEAVSAVPHFAVAHVLESPLDQTRRDVSISEYSIFQLHGHKCRLDRIDDLDLDRIEALWQGMLKHGRSEIVRISDSVSLHAFLTLACLEKAGQAVLVGEARKFVDEISGFFETSEVQEDAVVLGNFRGPSAAREAIRKFLLAAISESQKISRAGYSGEGDSGGSEISAVGCSSFKEEFSINFQELDERVKSKIYVKRKFLPARFSVIRSSPYVRKVEDMRMKFPDTEMSAASLAPFDVLTNTLGVKTELRWNKISGLAISGLTVDDAKFDFLYVQEISDLSSKISGLSQGGDVLVRLRSPWISEFSDAAWVMRLALNFRKISLVRSSLDPGHSFVFAENFFKQRRQPAAPVIDQVALFPSFVEFLKNFNFRVSLDGKRTTHVRPALNPLKAKDGTRTSRKLFVYFGSFDPVHGNHTGVIDSLAEKFPGSVVAVVPNRGENEGKKEISDYKDRLAMLRVRFGGESGNGVNIFETSETTETWAKKEKIANELGERIFENENEYFSLYLVLGEDSFKKATSWKNSGILKISSKIVVLPREGDENLEIPREMSDRVEVVGNHKDKFPGLSSSKLRRLISEGKTVPEGWIDLRVLQYAREHRLYKKNPADGDELFPDSD